MGVGYGTSGTRALTQRLGLEGSDQERGLQIPHPLKRDSDPIRTIWMQKAEMTAKATATAQATAEVRGDSRSLTR